MNPSPQFDFLDSQIQKLLDDNGFAEMSEAVRNEYVPQLIAEAQRRLGLAVLPLLSEQSAEELAGILESDSVTAEMLQDFWTRAVPNFEAVVDTTLHSFASEFKNILASLK